MKEIPLKMNRHKKLRIENSPSFFKYEIPLKKKSDQKKVQQKIEIAFNFMKDIPLKFTWSKKKDYL